MVAPPMLLALGFMMTSATALIYLSGRRVIAAKAKEIAYLMTHGRRPESKEFLGLEQAAKFPLTGSAVLGGLYLAIKFVPKWVLSYALTTYLVVVSVTGVAQLVKPVAGANVVVGAASWAVGGAYLATKHWILNNVLAFAICVTAMEGIPLKTYQTSALLLVGLFFYDIFWVFGTDVMVTVAKNVEGPIKLLFPQDVFGDHEKKSLLGLGDIVIPGLFVMQLLRIDMFLDQRHAAAREVALATPGTTKIPPAVRPGLRYYHVALVAYVLSLVNTMGIMVFFNAAQPALLYIVPWLLAGSVFTAYVRGELRSLWEFDEDAEDRFLAAKSPAAETGGNIDPTDPSVAEASFAQQVLDVLLMPFGLDSQTKAEKAAAAAKKSA